MKVLHVINNLGSGGAEKLIEEIVPLMKYEYGFEIDVLLLSDKGNVFINSLLDKGINVEFIKYNNIYDFRNIFKIKKHIDLGGYDIVHSHLFPTQYWVSLSKLFIKDKKVKFITTEHNTNNRRREKAYFKYIEKLIYYQYDFIISITEKTRDNLIEWIKPNIKNIFKYIVIENGVDIKKIEEALPYKKSNFINGIYNDTKLVCMVGRFVEQKNQWLLIKAIKNLPANIHLVLVGEGPLISDCKDLAENLGISDRVHFLGFRNDIPRILKTADIVSLSSHWEGFGLVAVEGMAARKPLLASNVDGLREVVVGAGLIFDSQEELEQCISSLIENDSFYEKVSNECYNRAKKYSIERMAENIKSVYIEVLKCKIE